MEGCTEGEDLRCLPVVFTVRTYSSSLCVTLQKFHNFVSFGQKSCSCALGGGWCEQEAHHSGAGQLSADAAQTQRGPYRDSMQTTETTISQEPSITSFFSSSFSLQAVWVLWISFARPWVLRQLAEHCMSEISGKLGMQGDRRRIYSRSWFERISNGLLCGILFCVLLGHISAFVHREVVRSLSSTRPPGTAGKDSDRPRGRSCERSQLMGFHWFFSKATPFWPRGVAE